MPGIFGYRSAYSDNTTGPAALKRMAVPVSYSPNDRLITVICDSFAGASVDYGNEFSLKPAVAQSPNVTLLIDGEVFPDAGEVPQSLREPAATIQRAEYCLHLYLEHGPTFAGRLNGSFGIALYDSRGKTLHLYTDRFLSRPLFVWKRDGDFAFASSVRALLRYRGDIGREYDPIAVAEFVGFEKVVSERTLFTDIGRLPPAAHAVLAGGKLDIERYFEFDPCAKTNLSSPREVAHRLADILKRSIAKRTADNCGLGVFLSGGIDSRLILALSPDSVSAITFTNDGMVNRERRLALKVAATRGVRCIELPRTTDYPVMQAHASVDINEGVFGSFLACRGVTFFDKLVEAGIRVATTGLYFDQILKGFFINDLAPLSRIASWPECVRSQSIGKVLSESALVRETYPLNLITLGLSDGLNDALAVAKERRIRNLSEWISRGGPIQDLVDRFPFENLLSVADLAPTTRTNRVRLVDRSLIYDNELADFAISIPSEWKRGGRLVRSALRDVSPGLAWFTDPKTGLPGALCSPLSWRTVRSFRSICRDTLARSSFCVKARSSIRNRWQSMQSVHPFNQGAYHDIDALLAFSPKYQELVRHSVDRLPRELFNVERVQSLLERDLSLRRPRAGVLFSPLVAFSLFDAKWGPNSDRSIDNCYLG
ncbi:MAG: asparagine synthase-related protein [Candidatus Eisenbacteria bacterium]|nr:asparagine synthase-related protein [Candidatus Eisenbacteria bacterium]